MAQLHVREGLQSRLAKVAERTRKPQEELLEEAVELFLSEAERWEVLKEREKDLEAGDFATPEELSAIEHKLSEWKHAG